MVGDDGVDDLRGAVEAPRDLAADEMVRPLDLLVNRLAEIVQQAATLQTLTSAPSSAAIAAASTETSMEWLSTFWP